MLVFSAYQIFTFSHTHSLHTRVTLILYRRFVKSPLHSLLVYTPCILYLFPSAWRHAVLGKGLLEMDGSWRHLLHYRSPLDVTLPLVMWFILPSHGSGKEWKKVMNYLEFLLCISWSGDIYLNPFINWFYYGIIIINSSSSSMILFTDWLIVFWSDGGSCRQYRYFLAAAALREERRGEKEI